jgi:dolichyl-phosphate-mannose-protein mannosyltransferase
MGAGARYVFRRSPWYSPARGSPVLEALQARTWRSATRVGWSPWILVFAAVFIATPVTRLYNLDRSYEVFVDEVSYLHIGQNVATKLRVDLYGAPFLLHPPAYFLLEGIWLRLFPTHGDLLHQVYALRYLNVVLAMVTVVALYFAARAVAGNGAGLIAAILFALDPYAVRTNSRILLETAAMMWVLLGLAVILPAIVQPQRATRTRLATAALAFGLGILTKDVTVFVSIVPLLICAIVGWGLPRRTSLLVAAGGAVPYLLYTGVLGAVGLFPSFLHEKLLGGSRLLGLVQVTGYHKAGSISFEQALLQQLPTLGSTYVMLIGGWVFATAFLILARGTRQQNANRFVGAFLVSVGALSVYAVLVGTLEDQMFYFPLVLDILGVALAVTQLPEWLRSRDDHAQTNPGLAPAIAAGCLALILVFSGFAWVRTHTTPDDGYARMIRWARVQRPGSVFSTTNEVQAFLLSDHFRSGVWATPQEVCANDVSFVVVSDKLQSNGFTRASRTFLVWLKANATVAYSTETPSLGRLVVYKFARPWPAQCPAQF